MTKTVIKEDKEKYKLETQSKFLETIKEEREEQEEVVTFHIGQNKGIFLTDSEFHLELTGSYTSELPDLV